VPGPRIALRLSPSPSLKRLRSWISSQCEERANEVPRRLRRTNSSPILVFRRSRPVTVTLFLTLVAAGGYAVTRISTRPGPHPGYSAKLKTR
jgi:hypothetical protein